LLFVLAVEGGTGFLFADLGKNSVYAFFALCADAVFVTGLVLGNILVAKSAEAENCLTAVCRTFGIQHL
jgi:hypothetical protein